MALITISRGTFSGGSDLAHGLASRLDHECVSREILLEAAEMYGVSAEQLAAGLEQKPAMLDRLGRARDRYVAYCRRALCEHALSWKLVYHGHAGHFLLAGVPQVMRVRIVAPIEFRLAAATRKLKVTRAEAQSYIERVDRDRVKWTQFLYHVDWNDPANYDVVINLERTTLDSACHLLAELADREEYRPDEEGKKAMLDLATRSRAVAALAADPRTEHMDLDVFADAGVVTVRGWAADQVTADAVPEVLTGVDGVAEVKSDIAVRAGILF